MRSEEYGKGVERKSAKSFRELVVWQKAHEFVLGVYRVTESFPKTELYGLTSQLRRAAVSVPANIAEGFRRTGKKRIKSSFSTMPKDQSRNAGTT